MKASVIIRTYNESEKIGLCLQAVCDQTAPFPFEVIVIDSESTDGTQSIVTRFPVRGLTIPKSSFTFGGALNIGCSIAHGEYLVFLSGHSVPKDALWLCTLIEGFEDAAVAGVYGSQIPHSECDLLERRLLLEGWPQERRRQKNDPFFSNANSAIRRSLWRDRPFNERLPYAEDREWVAAMQERGHEVLFEPRAAVYHSHHDTFFEYAKRRRKELQALTSLHGSACLGDLRRAYWHNLRRDIEYLSAASAPLGWHVRAVALYLYVMAVIVLLRFRTWVRP